MTYYYVADKKDYVPAKRGWEKPGRWDLVYEESESSSCTLPPESSPAHFPRQLRRTYCPLVVAGRGRTSGSLEMTQKQVRYIYPPKHAR